MLKQRVITAVLLLAVLVPCIFYPSPIPFGLVCLVLIGGAAWEWSRLNQYPPVHTLVHAGITVAVCGVLWWMGWWQSHSALLWLGVGGLWVLAGAWLLHTGTAVWSKLPKYFTLVVGLLALVVTWMAAMQARALGVNFLLSAMALVWVADIGAYVGGRNFGGKFFARKLAPSISPGKTWEGAVGGMVGVALLALCWIALDRQYGVSSPSLYTRLASGGYMYGMVCLAFLTAMSVVGDLTESLFKRMAGMKDSSQLLPGHGGVLDRIDSLLPTMPLALMLLSLGTP